GRPPRAGAALLTDLGPPKLSPIGDCRHEYAIHRSGAVTSVTACRHTGNGGIRRARRGAGMGRPSVAGAGRPGRRPASTPGPAPAQGGTGCAVPLTAEHRSARSMNGPAVHEPSAASTSWRVALPHTTAAVPVARALVRTALAERKHSADSDTAELLTAELVANAVEHTSGSAPIELVVRL